MKVAIAPPETSVQGRQGEGDARRLVLLAHSLSEESSNDGGGEHASVADASLGVQLLQDAVDARAPIAAAFASACEWHCNG